MKHFSQKYFRSNEFQFNGHSPISPKRFSFFRPSSKTLGAEQDTKLQLDQDHETHTKRANSKFRWNLLFIALFWIILPVPIWLPFIYPYTSALLLTSVQCIFLLIWSLVSAKAVHTFYKLLSYKVTNTKTVNCVHQTFHHLVILSSYKEPIDVLIETISTLAVQPRSSTNVTLVLSFEEKTPELSIKTLSLTEMFDGKFRRIITTIHPFACKGEIPGKCSNSNFGLRKSIKLLQTEGINTDDVIITSCDADNKFHRGKVLLKILLLSVCLAHHFARFCLIR